MTTFKFTKHSKKHYSKPNLTKNIFPKVIIQYLFKMYSYINVLGSVEVCEVGRSVYDQYLFFKYCFYFYFQNNT